MSPAATRRFRVTLLVGRKLTRGHIEAADETAAMEIAQVLFSHFSDRPFIATGEDVIDCSVEPEEVAS